MTRVFRENLLVAQSPQPPSWSFHLRAKAQGRKNPGSGLRTRLGGQDLTPPLALYLGRATCLLKLSLMSDEINTYLTGLLWRSNESVYSIIS